MNSDTTASRNVLIVGGSGGIGGAIALECAAVGWRVAVHHQSRRHAAEKIVADITAAGHQALMCQADVRAPDQVKAMVADVLGVWPAVDAMVYCAGVASSRLCIRTSETEWDDLMRVNLSGAFHCLRAIGGHMIERRRGSIVLVGSFAGSHGAMGQAAYASSKAALVGLARSAAIEWGDARVRVNVVLPGWHATALSRGAMPAADGYADHVLSVPPALPDVARAIRQLMELPGASGQVWNLDSRIV